MNARSKQEENDGDKDSSYYPPFFPRFRRIMLMSFTAGIYFPGMETLLPPFTEKVATSTNILIYLWLANIPPLISIGDRLYYLVSRYSLINAMVIVYVLVMCSVYVWIFLIRGYLIMFQNKVSDIVNMWTNIPTLSHPKIREGLLRKVERNAWAKCVSLTCLLTMPFFLMMFYKVYLGELFSLSSFGNGTRNAPRIGVFLQGLSIISITHGYAMYQSLISLFLMLLKAEFQYLIECVKMSNANIEIQTKGGRSEMLGTFTKFQKYHNHLFKLLSTIEEVYLPVLYFDFAFLSMATGTMLLCGLTGVIPGNFAYPTIGVMLVFSLITLTSCRIGDQIRDKAQEVGNAVFHWDWYSQPKDVKKIIFMMVMLSNQRQATLGCGGLAPLVSTTFRQLVFLQYRFFRFMIDVRDRD